MQKLTKLRSTYLKNIFWSNSEYIITHKVLLLFFDRSYWFYRRKLLNNLGNLTKISAEIRFFFTRASKLQSTHKFTNLWLLRSNLYFFFAEHKFVVGSLQCEIKHSITFNLGAPTDGIFGSWISLRPTRVMVEQQLKSDRVHLVGYITMRPGRNCE